MAEYRIFLTDDGIVMAFGSVEAANDMEAIRLAAREISQRIESSTLNLDYRVSIKKPDDTLVLAPATVAEFVKK
jgi:hypothetical protein